MKPSLFLGIDKSSSPESIQNQLRKKRDQISKHVSSDELKKFDVLIQTPRSSRAFFAWGDKNGIWIGSKEDFEYYEPVSESHVDMDEQMKPLSFKQKKIAKMGGNPNKIDAPDFAALRAKRRGPLSKMSAVAGANKVKNYMGKTTESKAEQVVNRLVGESELDILATANPDLVSELSAGMDAGEHDETDMSNSEERTEVEIANEILHVLDNDEIDMDERHNTVRDLANELLSMHGQDHESSETPGEEAAEHDEDFEEIESK
jgi:hypothetical protein